MTRLNLFATPMLAGLLAALLSGVAQIPAQAPPRALQRQARRVALVIGNNAYRGPGLALTGARPDAEAVARDLRELGFRPEDIFTAYDADLSRMRKAARDFLTSLGPGDLAFIYYAGHGVEVRGKNYLLPVEFSPGTSELEVMDEAYAAQDLLERLEATGAVARILVLDACRNNPLRTRSTGRGLAGMEGSGTLIIFPTQSGKVTPDNGLFRREMLRGLRQPGVAADDAFKRIGRAVYQASKGEQTPAIYGLLLEDFAFVAGSATSPEPPPPDPRPVVVRRGPEPGDVKELPEYKIRMRWIPPGSFQMGCSPGDTQCDDDEKPARRETIERGFWAAETETSVEQWKAVYGKAPSWSSKWTVAGQEVDYNPGWGTGEHPVIGATWEEAKGFCEAIGARLPSAREWEYMARAGEAGARYGNLEAIAWYADNSGRERLDSAKMVPRDGKWDGYNTRLRENGNGPHGVRSKQPNAWGLYNVLGNVWEWTADWYEEGKTRELRGGSSVNYPSFLRVSNRVKYEPSNQGNNVGFRCAGE